jgi:ribosome maturation factor RimP
VDLKEKIEELVVQCIENDKIFLVEVDIKGNPNNQIIQVFIDGDASVDVDECSKISRKLSGLLEDMNLFEGRYVIEVSSPGVSRPLKYLRQYPKHIGRDLEILTKDKNKYKGELVNVNDQEIEISVKQGKSKKDLTAKTLKFEIPEIATAKVLIRF